MKKYFLLVFGFLLLHSLFVDAQIGSLDPSFDTDGTATTLIALGNSTAYSVALQNDGKLVVVGYARDVFGSYMALTRYLPNGALDLSFDTDGIVTTDISPNDDVAYDVAIQTDGKIVVCGSSEQTATDPQITIVRYLPNGSIDSSFDGDGIAVAFENSQDQGIGSSVQIQTDGKILVAGYLQGKFTVIRLLSNGHLDSTFNADGILKYHFYSGGYSDAQQVNLQADGKIIISGYASDVSGVQAGLVIVRLDSIGNFDTTFNHTGIVKVIATSPFLKLNSLLLQSDQKIVLTGSTIYANDGKVLVYRFLPDGTPDSSFATIGSTYRIVGDDWTSEFSGAIQPDGKIVLCGVSHDGSYKIGLIRFQSNGTPDSMVGGNGLVYAPTYMYASSQMLLQPDGKFVVVGTGTYTIGANIFYTTRLMATFPLELPTFTKANEFTIGPNPNHGNFTVNFSEQTQHAQLILFDENGKRIHQTSSNAENKVMISLPGLPPGNYWLEVAESNHVSKRRQVTLLAD